MKKLYFILLIILSSLSNNFIKSQCTTFSLNTSVGSFTIPCNPSSIIINAVNTSTVSPIFYDWIGPIQSLTNNNTYTCTVPGTYTIIAHDFGYLCNIQQTFTVFPNSGAPSVTATPSSFSLTCNGPLVTFSSICSPTLNISGQWHQPNYVPITAPGIALSFTTTNPGMYTAIYTDNSNGCIGAKTVFAENTGTPVIPSMTIAVTPTPQITCSINTTSIYPLVTYVAAPFSLSLINLTTNTTYPFMAGYTATASGYYMGEMTNGDFCKISLPIYIDANIVQPTINISGTSTLCSGYGNTLNVTGANSYTWSTGVNSNSIIVSPTTTTTYSVVGMNTINGCTGVVSFTQSVSPCAGIEEFYLKNNIALFPNPTTGIINFSLENNEFKNSEIEIRNTIGQTVLKLPYKNQIDVSELSNGVYILQIKNSNNQIVSERLIIAK